tara:strand:- start:16151 stop:17248 length:1098 start_codon:yes stop_codon:yes gene_type:complete
MEEKKEEVKQEGEFKMKKKPSKPKKLSNTKAETPKIEIKKPEDTTSEQSIVKIDNKPVEELKKEEVKAEESSPIQEIEKQEHPTPIAEAVKTEEKLPQGVKKLVDFMEETGGDMQDYVRLNADYSDVDENVLLKEYYKNSKPHLNDDEISFIMEEKFKVDEDYDEERDQRRKKLAKKEEVVKAKDFLENLKSKYYEEIKLRPTVNNEIKKAGDFFNRYKQEQEIAKKQHEDFKNVTNNYFTNEFEGFEFGVGEKNFRYSVNNPSDVAEAQSDISNVLKKFLNEKGEVIDYKGYHKAMYAARNADTIANHFYEQGKADAVKDVMAKSKNIDSSVRQTKAPDDIYMNGFKVKAVNGLDSSKLKIKKR